ASRNAHDPAEAYMLEGEFSEQQEDGTPGEELHVTVVAQRMPVRVESARDGEREVLPVPVKRRGEDEQPARAQRGAGGGHQAARQEQVLDDLARDYAIVARSSSTCSCRAA